MGFEDDDEPYYDDDERDAIIGAAITRRDLWSNTVIASIRAGMPAVDAMRAANFILDRFDDRFPEVRAAADLEEMPG